MCQLSHLSQLSQVSPNLAAATDGKSGARFNHGIPADESIFEGSLTHGSRIRTVTLKSTSGARRDSWMFQGLQDHLL